MVVFVFIFILLFFVQRHQGHVDITVLRLSLVFSVVTLDCLLVVVVVVVVASAFYLFFFKKRSWWMWTASTAA